MSERKCTTCGAVLDGDSVFCNECGTVQAAAVAAPVAIPEETGLKPCPQCAKRVAETVKFCPSCAFDFSKAVGEPETASATCPKCGRNFAATDEFCRHCAFDLRNGQANQAPQARVPFESREQTIGAADSSASPELDFGTSSNRAKSVGRRYLDAYLTARAVDAFGKTIKGIGVAIGLLVIGIALLGALATGRGEGFAIGLMTAIIGALIGTLIYLLGVLVAAQGQILKASLDGAVNSSPFLTDDQKAKVMLLTD
ncbi:MAG: zinc ribbon domain-containing protein [Acidobacteria bacterium]|nr:zinc ribbon domain-containing protein [Acidobacteriota bacterium]